MKIIGTDDQIADRRMAKFAEGLMAHRLTTKSTEIICGMRDTEDGETTHVGLIVPGVVIVKMTPDYALWLATQLLAAARVVDGRSVAR